MGLPQDQGRILKVCWLELWLSLSLRQPIPGVTLFSLQLFLMDRSLVDLVSCVPQAIKQPTVSCVLIVQRLSPLFIDFTGVEC